MSERLAQAVALRAGGEPGQARPLLLALRAEFPSDPEIARQTAWVHDVLGLEAEAVPHYRAAIAGGLPDADLADTMLGLGSTLRALGRDDEAEEAFQAALRRFPGHRPLRAFHALLRYNAGDARQAVAELLHLLVETTADPDIQQYGRALTSYADDLDRGWLAS
ncbi:tetratricopeptide repeat protein [Actinoplanes sp. DH11]|uniref:tetratricopeptide repeat protein n=1 Tax=Actinoplanes sp. DH11 TaxID=2857011 RepID=UPI001E5A3DFB|nr:tetratricopeptide repeat protein [Actinoplanes sp. DH11]